MTKREDIVKTAQKEIGTMDAQSPKYSAVNGHPYRIEWCASFTSWVYHQHGLLGTAVPNTPSCPTTKNWFVNKNRFKNRSYEPKPGDIIMFNWNLDGKWAQHQGIVEKTDKTYVYTIEGNTGSTIAKNRKVMRKKWAKNSNYILGYGIPDVKEWDTPTPTETEHKTVNEIAKEVIRGNWGNNPERRKRLEAAGYNYSEVQDEVNRLLSKDKPAKPKLKPLNEIAKEVLKGSWGNAPERKQKLEAAGYNYSEVQTEVNKLIAQQAPSKPKLKTPTEVAKEVLAGKWGNGAVRKRNLEAAGYNYSAVQKAVNKLIANSKPSQPKITDKLIQDVIRGKYGNGQARKRNLELEGYNYTKVQEAVNEYLKK